MKLTQKTPNEQPRTAPWLPLGWYLIACLMAVVWSSCGPVEKKVAGDIKGGGDTKTAVETPGAINPAGTYTLVTVDGNKVPYKVTHEGHSMTITSGSFIIDRDGTCCSRISLEGSNEAVEVQATYTQDGEKLTMKWQGAGTTVGSIKGDVFTMNNEGMVFSYRK